MYYGDEKRLQMSRGILPSSAHGIRAWRRRIHKAERAGVRADLVRALRAPDLDAWAEDPDPGLRRRRDVQYLVWRRRSADKLGAFFRWAEAVTRHVAPGGRRSFVRGALPAGLIGDHALSHLEQIPHFLGPNEAEVHALARWRQPSAPGARTRTRADREALLREVVIDGEAHRRLNAMLRAAAPEGTRARLLHGLGDIGALLDVFDAEREARKRTYPPVVVQLDRLDGFLEQWELRE